MALDRGRLRALREAYGPREKLAEALKVSPTTVYNWEATESVPAVDKLVAAARELGTTAAYLLGETDDPSPGALRRPVAADIDVFIDEGTEMTVEEAIAAAKEELKILMDIRDAKEKLGRLERLRKSSS